MTDLISPSAETVTSLDAAKAAQLYEALRRTRPTRGLANDMRSFPACNDGTAHCGDFAHQKKAPDYFTSAVAERGARGRPRSSNVVYSHSTRS